MTVSSEKSSMLASYRNLLSDTRMVSIALVSFYATLGTNVVSPALPAMADGLGVSDSQIGLVITVYSLAAMIFVPLSGVAADSYGRRAVLIPSITIFGISGIAIAFADTLVAVLLFRGIQGAAYASLMPITVTLLGDIYSGNTGAAAQGFRVSTNGIGSSAVPVLVGFLAGYAWNYPFFIYFLVVPILIVTYLYIPETVENSEGGPDRISKVKKYLGGMKVELLQANFGVLVFGEGVRDFVRYAVLTFIPLFAVRVLDASFAAAGSVLAARGIAYILVSPASGAIVNRFSRKEVLIGSLLLSSGSIISMAFAPSVIWVAIFVGSYTVGDSLFSPVIKDSVAALASDGQRGGIISTMNLLKYAGQASSPTFFGIIVAVSGFPQVFYIAAGIATIYAIILAATVSNI